MPTTTPQQPLVALDGPVHWWQKEVIYQVYPASFRDEDDDGIGDLRGIIAKLPYLKSLGITMIWVSPVYASPMVDNGYDISDYRAINPMFGTMADCDELIARARDLDIKVIMDLVVNHTSDEHQWFREALADPMSTYRDFYIFRQGHDGGPPTNWRSNFGQGPSWTEVPGEPGTYYHHVFSPRQPDLNWENPALRETIFDMVNWWLDKGLAGFRIDAITFIKKDPGYRDLEPDGNDGLGKVRRRTENQPGIEDFLNELKDRTFSRHDAVTVGEASGVRYDQLDQFIGDHGYFSMIFDFHYADIDVESGSEWYRQVDWNVPDFKELLFTSQMKVQEVGWAANFLENHDQPRSVSKFIRDPEYRNGTGAKALGATYFFLRGVPFIYQGQELGMVNAERTSINQFSDLSSHDNYRRAQEEGFSPDEALGFVNDRSRDNGRTPFHWDGSATARFSDSHEPWLGLSLQSDTLNVAAQEDDPDSVLNFYRRMVELRNDSGLSAELIYGDIAEITDVPDDVIAYRRGQRLHVYANWSTQEQTVTVPTDRTVRVHLNNLDRLKPDGDTVTLLPYQAILVEVDAR